MEPAEVLKSNAVELLSMPVHQPKFIALLRVMRLLNEDVKSGIRDPHLTEKEAAQLLVADIEKSLVINRNRFDRLILVMQEYEEGGMKELAKKMKHAAVKPSLAGT